jgi:hypothetical protein
LILRRLKAHIEKENWFAVGIDFCIVVIGVFIGLQVANWNVVRADQIRTVALLERLDRDFEGMRVRAVEQNRQFYDNTVKLNKLLSRAEDADDIITDEEAGQLLNGALLFRTPQAAPISFQEMLAAGRLELLRDPALRRVLREYAASARVVESGSDLIANDYIVVLRELSPSITVTRAPNAIGAESATGVAALSVAALREDPKVRGLVTHLFLGHGNMQSLTEQQISSIDEVLRGLRASAESQP